jgi:thymidylate synthase (FAD)
MKGLINFLMREKHMSPFEHGSFTFKIDCPIFVAREFHRHSTMVYNEVSGRYTEMKPRFYVPGNSRPVVQQGKAGQYTFTEDSNLLYRSIGHIAASTSVAWDHYQSMLNEGVAKEVARMALPNNLMTQFYATVNPRNLMHFLGLRTSPQALYEIREVAEDMEKALAEQMPMTYDAWKGPVVGHVGTGKSTGPHVRIELNVNEGIMTRNEVQRSFDRGRE